MQDEKIYLQEVMKTRFGGMGELSWKAELKMSQVKQQKMKRRSSINEERWRGGGKGDKDVD